MSTLHTRRRVRTVASLMISILSLVLATLTSASAGAAPDAGILATTFADEFNGPAGSPVDGSKWVMETGDNVNNHELQWYTNSTRNAAMDGQGNLVITARRENPG